MTLFVDCSDSDFISCKTGKCKDENLFKRDIEAFRDYFKDSNFSAAIFNDFPDVGNGLILLKNSNDSDKTIVHIRCTSQNNDSQCLIFKLNISLRSSILENNKNKTKRVLEALGVKFNNKMNLKSISCNKMKKNILKMDMELKLNRFKFGVAYLDRFDTSEDQMLSNTIEDSSPSEAFSNFIKGLGDEIYLKGWKGFSGGLDVSEDSLTGSRAIYNKENQDELIYHIAPWLPQLSSQINLERKRHFGNDTIVIIFSESLYAFELKTLISQQIQVVLFVRFINHIQKYQVHIYSKLSDLMIESNPFYIQSVDDFKKFSNLLISLERQCYNLKPLVDKLYCMRNFYLNQIINKFK